MKRNCINYIFLIAVITGIFVCSCEKAASEKDFGFSKIYMPQAMFKSGGTTNNYPVPSGTDSSTYNYVVDTKEKKLNIILGAAVSGPGSDGYTVDIKVDNDTIQQLFTSKVLDTALYKLMPASMYSLPGSLEVTGGKTGTFYLSVDIAQLKLDKYIGKYLVLAVKLANPSRYELNSAISTTIVIIDVNALVIGPSVNVTSTYILNPGTPAFVAATMNGSRWGSLKDWKANTAALSHGGVGGFSLDGDGATMDLESGWGSPLIANGKIYQTVTLPAGTYAFDPSGGAWKWQGTKDPGYVVVAPGIDSLPNYNNIVNNTSVQYKVIAQPQALVYFELGAPGKVTLGVVVNYVQDQQGIKSTKVLLYNYPKHL